MNGHVEHEFIWIKMEIIKEQTQRVYKLFTQLRVLLLKLKLTSSIFIFIEIILYYIYYIKIALLIK